MVWHGRAVGRGHSFISSFPCRAVMCVWPGPLTHSWIFLLDCLDTAAAGSVVPARHYFLYAEVARAKHPKVKKAFPPLRYCLLRITCVGLCSRTAPSGCSHHCTLTQLSATQLILMACLRPSHPMSSITQLSHFSMQRPPEIALNAFVESRVPRWKNYRAALQGLCLITRHPRPKVRLMFQRKYNVFWARSERSCRPVEPG